MKRHAITLAVLALVVGGIAFRQQLFKARGTPEVQPQDAIYAMLDAARAGDVKGYLASYTGGMAASLEQSVKESGEAGFARYLRDSNAALKGVAVQAPQTGSGGDATVRVEYVYQDRNEAQSMVLQKIGGTWKIARVDGAERVKTLVPYGTPVE
jgi:hypothetical protein